MRSLKKIVYFLYKFSHMSLSSFMQLLRGLRLFWGSVFCISSTTRVRPKETISEINMRFHN